MSVKNTISRLLSSSNLFFGIWASFASFLAYFCMYMYRKPYTAGTFDSLSFFDIDYKILIVVAQVTGYALSKFIGIKVISELDNSKRIQLFLLFIGVAWLALVGFAFSPAYLGPLWLFINGLPLGMIWGILFSYCEGRKLTEVITVFISTNFILSSGIAKSLGRWVLSLGYTEHMMPMIIGLIVFPMLLFALWMLSKIPPPTKEETQQKTKRNPMTSRDRKLFVKKYWLPLTLFILFYLVLTIIRDIRDNFAVEIWNGLGYGEHPEIFTTTELPVTLLILISLGLLYRIKDNKKALLVNMLLSFLGISLFFGTTLLMDANLLNPILWMILSGIGLFLPYILLNGIIFDRFIASFRIIGNVGFIMYLSDAFGYLGSILIMLYKNFGNATIEWLAFYKNLCFFGGFIGLFLSFGIFYSLKRMIDAQQKLVSKG